MAVKHYFIDMAHLQETNKCDFTLTLYLPPYTELRTARIQPTRAWRKKFPVKAECPRNRRAHCKTSHNVVCVGGGGEEVRSDAIALGRKKLPPKNYHGAAVSTGALIICDFLFLHYAWSTTRLVVDLLSRLYYHYYYYY